MDDLVIGAVIAAIVGVVALAIRTLRTVDAPTQRTFAVPDQIDRADFGSPVEEWLIIVFTSRTCPVCADVTAKAQALASRHVATRAIDHSTHREVHDRYRIDAVPLALIVDAQGAVRHHFLGPVSATDLWAAVAAVRAGADPASQQCSGH